jgi:hypothetical protein
MSTLWNVEAEQVEGRTAVLRLVRTHPDAGPFRDDATFALRVIHEALLDEPGPLDDAVNEDLVLTERWTDANAGRFVAGVEVDQDDDVATYRITVTDERWIAHLRPGAHWHSAAFS